MKAVSPLVAVKRTVQDVIDDVRNQRFFRDRLSMALLIGAMTISIVNLAFLLAQVHPSDTQVPVRFSSLYLFDALGPWYFPYLIVTYAFATTLINAILAYQSFHRSRLASFFLLIGSVVVAVFSFIISMAFGAIR